MIGGKMFWKKTDNSKDLKKIKEDLKSAKNEIVLLKREITNIKEWLNSWSE